MKRKKSKLIQILSSAWQWIGVGEKKGWDVLQLLITASIPILIFIRTQDFTEKNNKQQLQAAKDNANQATLVKYFEEMATLLDDGLLKVEKVSDEKFIMAQVQTVIALQSLDPKRQQLVIQFLDAASLNTFPNTGADKGVGIFYKARISKANLDGVDLRDARLRLANLNWASLRSANLRGAIFNSANLSNASLTKANLSHTSLIRANLSDSDLTKANLSDSQLRVTNFTNANLSSANLSSAILINTDLRETKNLIQPQLEGKKPPLICNSPLPKNIKIDSNRDCDEVIAFLHQRYPNDYPSLKEAEKYVQEKRNKKWD
ncbi:pentapeptide repeat-containing protein [Acaryochloris marina NIES-2412]|uniref:pentapeptide repeat-containing protein n=1 Tax=Acaryochloris marina TaxID=155978 RepID=UPI004058D975